MADLEAAYVLPEGAQNAADLYEKAFVLFMNPIKPYRIFCPFVVIISSRTASPLIRPK